VTKETHSIHRRNGNSCGLWTASAAGLLGAAGTIVARDAQNPAVTPPGDSYS